MVQRPPVGASIARARTLSRQNLAGAQTLNPEPQTLNPKPCALRLDLAFPSCGRASSQAVIEPLSKGPWLRIERSRFEVHEAAA